MAQRAPVFPPRPPELLGVTGPIGRIADWNDQIIRRLIAEFIGPAGIGSLEARIASLESSVSTLESRVKDAYTFSHPGVVLVQNNLPGVTLRAVSNGTLVEAIASVVTAPTGQAMILDLLKNGVSIFGATKLEIAAGQRSGTQTTFAAGTITKMDEIQLNCTQVGSAEAGRDLTVLLLVK